MRSGKAKAAVFLLLLGPACSQKPKQSQTEPTTAAADAGANVNRLQRRENPTAGPTGSPEIARQNSALSPLKLEQANRKRCSEIADIAELRTATGIEMELDQRRNSQLDRLNRCEWVAKAKARKLPAVRVAIDCAQTASFDLAKKTSESIGKTDTFEIGTRGFKRQLSEHGFIYGFEAGGCVTEVHTVHLPDGTENAAARVVAGWLMRGGNDAE